MKYNNLKYIISILLAIILALSFTACGSGGGGGGSSAPANDSKTGSPTDSQPASQQATVAGVAATGAPVTGDVYLKDSNGIMQGPVPIAADGSYSFNVDGLTPPFYLKAVNTTTGEALYSVSLGAGTANINPLTNLAVAVAAGISDPAAVYNDPFSYPVTQTRLDNSIADIRNMLAPLLENSNFNANINFLTDTFIADHTGLDKVFDEMLVEHDTVSGKVTFVLRGIQIGQAQIDSFLVLEGVTEAKIHAAIIGSSALGTGSTCPYPATLSMNVAASGEGTLSYDFQETFLQATSVDAPSIVNGTVTITGAGNLSGDPGHTFTARIKEGSPDQMSIDIDGVPSPVAGTLPLIGGPGYTAAGGAVSGIGQTCPFPASLNLSVNSSSLGTGWLRYDFQDTFLDATSITSVIVAGGTATITGMGILNGDPGHAFEAIVKDGSPDEMSIDIDVISSPVAGTLSLIGGAGFTVY